MWMGSIRLRVSTADTSHAGTDSLVTATIMRDGDKIVGLSLDYEVCFPSMYRNHHDSSLWNKRYRRLPKLLSKLQ